MKYGHSGIIEAGVLQKVISQYYQHKKDLESSFDNNAVDEGVILMLLYGLVVLPWEVLQNQLRKEKWVKKKLLSEWCNFELLTIEPRWQRKPIRLYFFLLLMRNALSHATINVSSDGAIIFYDRSQTKIKLEFLQLWVFLNNWVAYLEETISDKG